MNINKKYKYATDSPGSLPLHPFEYTLSPFVKGKLTSRPSIKINNRLEFDLNDYVIITSIDSGSGLSYDESYHMDNFVNAINFFDL